MASSVVLTEISLNESSQLTSGQDEAININLIPVPQTVVVAPILSNGIGAGALNASNEYAIPPASELPSYNEALRLKKQEANEVPPSYYPTTNAPDSRIIIDETEVKSWPASFLLGTMHSRPENIGFGF